MNGRELTSQEESDIQRWRIIERATEMKGDSEKMEAHRANLQDMFESMIEHPNMSNHTKEQYKETWKALDTDLEADIIYADTLAPGDE